MQQEVTYVWTNQDQLIWGGTTAGSAQGPYVSPYGIQPTCVPNPPAPGKPIQLDLAWSVGGQCGRANRFHVTGGWVPTAATNWADWSTDAPVQPGERDPSHGYHAYEWVVWSIPPGVKTLGELCDHLVATDPSQYPKQIYGSRSPRHWDTNAAMMLFDYWGNSKFRQATCDSGGFDWEGTYMKAPDSIALVAPSGATLTWVLRRKTVLPKVPAAPGAKGGGLPGLITRTRSQSELDTEMDDYISKLEGCAANIKWLFDVSDNVMKRRCQVVRAAAGIRAAAFASTLSLKQGNDDAVEIASLLDEVLPAARDWLMQQPVAQTDRATSEPLPGTGLVLGGDIAHQTHNARASMDSEVAKLDRLLFGNVWLDITREWMASVVDILQNHNTAIDWDALEKGSMAPGFFPHLDTTGATFARYTRLQRALAAAVECYGEAAYPSDGTTRTVSMTPDDLLKLFDNAREFHARAPSDIAGATPLEVSLSLVGKFYSFAKETSKIGVALLRVGVTWDVFRFAKTTLKTGGTAAAASFAETIIQRLPDLDVSAAEEADRVKLRTEAGDVLRKGERSATRKLADKVARKAAAEPAAWKSLCAVLDILNLMMALGKASSPSDGLVAAVDWMALGVESVDVLLGSAEALAKHLGEFENVVAKLARLGTAVKVLGALLAFAQGGIALIDGLASGRKDAVEITRAALLLTGGAAGLFTAAAIHFGIATGGVGFAIEAFGIACVLAATAIDMGRAIAKDTPFVETMNRLLVDLRHEPEWSAFERASFGMREKMQRVEICCKGERGLYPGANTMNHWRHLRANGLSDDDIRKLLSVGEALGPLDADSSWGN